MVLVGTRRGCGQSNSYLDSRAGRYACLGMNALTFDAPRSVRVTAVPEPVISSPGDAIVRVELSAICGSDLHVWRGAETGLDAGTIMGHEFLGEVVELGSETSGLRTGDRVVAPFTTSCGACAPCTSGLTSRCERGQLFGWVQDGQGLHGAQAAFVRVPLASSTLVPVDRAGLPEELLFAGDVLATGYFCAESGGAGPGKTVAVLGCGPVGLMAIVAARELGAEHVFGVDRVPERLALAASYGAQPVEPGALAANCVDVVLEAVGSPEATRLGFDLLRPGGTLAAVGVHTESHFAFSPGEAYDKNLTYRAGRAPVRAYMQRLVELIGTGRHDLAAIISHRIDLAHAPRAYELFDQKLDGCTKVVIEFP